MAKEIVVTVAPDGGISIDAIGFKGRSCEAATAFLEKALGQAVNSKKKAEFYQTETQRVSTGQG